MSTKSHILNPAVGFFVIILAFLFSFSSISRAQEYRGQINGAVTDATTLEPIPAVNIIIIEIEKAGTSTNAEGAFILKQIPVGTYSLQVSAVGYITQIITNVVVTTGRATPLTVKLEQKAVEMGEVTVEESYFSKAQQMSPVSANVIQRSEVLRSPGGIQDVQRVVQNLPGVASSTDNINELIVRGGAPYENLTVMDNMEIPSINHYPNQFNSAGPINMVNAEMVDDAQFSAGGFPVQYGDKSSSVLNISVREGNRNVAFASKSGFNMAGIGTLVEGGFAGGRGSYIFSARNSLLEIIDKLFGLSTLSLTAVPRYWDTQAKIVYDINQSNKLMLNVLYGDSRITVEGDPNEKDDLRKNIIDSSSVEYLSPVTKQFAYGLSLRSLWGTSGYSVLTLYSQGTNADVFVREDFTRHVRDEYGDVLEYSILNSRPVFINRSNESFFGAKYEMFYKLHSKHNLLAGIQVQTARSWQNDVFVEADTIRFDLDKNGSYETDPVIIPQYRFQQRLGFADASKYFIYCSDTYTPGSSLSITCGLRYDHFTYSGKGSLSPRGSISYSLVPQITKFTFALGTYYQTQPFPYYSDRRSIGYNKTIDNIKAVHYVLGFEQILPTGLKLSVETYYKAYSGLAVSEDFIYSEIDTFWSDRLLNIGRRYSYGIELYLEQRQVKDYFGTVSVSLSRSRMKDPRIPKIVNEYASEFDYPLVITLLGGKVVKNVRSWLNNAPFFLKYPSYILPLSDEMEISFKYRYQTGRPYTPMQYVTWRQFREGGVKWSSGTWISTGDENGARYPDYSRLDLQWISRFYFNTWNINVFVAFQNVLNRKNVFYENLRSDGTVETVYQFTFFPVAGVEVEF